MTNFKKWVLSALLLGSAFMGTAAIADDAYQQASDAVARDNDEAARRQHEYYKNQPSMGNSNVNPNTGSAIGSSAPRVILPDSWGAVAWNFKTGGFDSSFGMASSSTAKSLAMQKCGKGCKITTTYKNQCLAYAFGSQPKAAGYFSNVSDRNQARAEQLALNNCSEKAQNCQIVISECSMP